MKKRVAILISGSGSNMLALAAAMAGPDFPAKPVLVVADRAGAGGLDKARDLGIAAELVERAAFPDRASFETALHLRLSQARAEILCLAGFMRVLSPGFVGQWHGNILNIHPSLLPKYPGLHTHARALAAGDAEHGASVHEVTADLDAGPLLGRVRIRVLPGDTPLTLAERLLPQEHRLYPAVLRRFASGDRSILELG